MKGATLIGRDELLPQANTVMTVAGHRYPPDWRVPMSDQRRQAEDVSVEAAPASTQVAEVPAGEEPQQQVVLDELLVEDVSIDGMCGVY
jgi:mycofactocin precursor